MTKKTLFIIAALGLTLFGGPVLAQQQPPQSPNMSFFVTSVSLDKGGNLGGLEGADRHCQAPAQNARAGSKTRRTYLSTQADGATPG